MSEFNLDLHKWHIDTFFETFFDNLKERSTDEEKIKYVDYLILLEQQRLNRYLTELKPDLYINHKLYVCDINHIILKLTEHKKSLINSMDKNEVLTYKWKIEKEKLILLYEKLKDDFINPDTSFETFSFLFSEKPLKEAKTKIDWLKVAKNKQPNKKSITDLIDILASKSVIEKMEGLRKKDEITILNTLFSSNKKELKFSNSNFTSTENTSEYRMDLEDIINSIF